MPPAPGESEALRAEIEAVPKDERLDYLARQPSARRDLFVRILSPEDRRKLMRRIDLLERKKREPTLESWLEDARRGRASTPEAMIEVLREAADKIRAKDADWIRRIDETAGAGGFSRKQRQVIEGIYARYFPPR